MSLIIDSLHVSVDQTPIIHGLSLTIPKGEVHVIMGPNGSGKSTLLNTLMGHPSYTVTSGTIVCDDVDITHMSPDERAKAGLFLSMQYPPEIAGVTIGNFLRVAHQAMTGMEQSPVAFHTLLQEHMARLHIDPSFSKRYLNQGFSGGEKKKAEILQLAVLNPTYALLDETDSGLDVDALRIVSEGINAFRSPEKGILLITHYTRILSYIEPDVVHIMKDGRIIHTGDKTLATAIEAQGYDSIIVS